MGLSFKPLGHILGAIATPFEDAGKAVGDIGSYTAGALTGNQQAQANASQALSNAVQGATHNPATNFVGSAVKFIPQFAENYANTFANLGNRLAGAPNASIQQNMGGDILSNNILSASGATGKNTQLFGDVGQIGLAALAPESEKLAQAGVGRVIGSNAPKLVAKFAPRIASNAALASGFNAANAYGQGATAGQVAKAAGQGAALGAAIGPFIKGAKPQVDAAIDTAKAADPATKASLEQAGQEAAQSAKLNIPQRTSLVTPETPSGVNTTAPSSVKTAVALPTPRANTGFPTVDKAINDVADHYSTPGAQRIGSIDQVLEQTKGQERLGARLSQKLGAIIKKEFSPAENQAIDDALDGNITQDLTPEAAQVVNALRPLMEQGFNVRQAIKPDIGQVVDYSPRVEDNTLRGSATRGAAKLQSIGSKLNLNSGFSEARSNNKFISKDSTLIGSPKALGLTDKGNGNFVDESGKVFKIAHATKGELEQAGVGTYARRASTVNRVYHTDTTALKARAETIQELQQNPGGHGLYTEEQFKNGVAPKGVRPIAGVPGLEGLYASDKDAHSIQDALGFGKSATPAPLRAYDAVTNAVTQFIVLNPLFHGVNQLYQTAIAAGNLPGLKGLPGHGMASVLKSIMTLNENDIRAVMEAGGGGTDYGASMENILSKMTGGATKLSAKGMAALEIRFRAALYKSSLEKGMSKTEAVDNINTFLGSTKHVNETARRAILFAHYLRTMTGAMGRQIAHPIEERGSIANTITMAAVGAAMSYGYAKLTGNPNSIGKGVRAGGEVGLAESLINAGVDAAKGKPSTAMNVIEGRINPVAKEAVQQATGKDLFTKQDITSDRLGHAATSLIAPAAMGTRVTEGKRSGAELIANELGLSTPHAKGYQAAPNLPFLNTPGAITAKTGDPTGYQQQRSYFDNLDALKKTFAGSDKNTQDALNKFLDRSHDPVTGQAIKNSPADTVENSGALATNPKLMAAVQKFEKSQPQHDPMWDLAPDKLEYLMTYKAMLEGSAERNVLKANATDPATGDNWIDDLTKAQQDFYNNLPKVPGGKAPEDNPNTPQYPVFDQQTTDLLAAYNSATPDQRSQLIKDNPGELSSAFNAIAQWTNNMRKAQTGKDTPQLNIYPEADPKTQAIINTYNALPKGNGKHGGSPDRAAWIKANPDAYAQMQNYLTQTSMYSLIKNAALAQFQGTKASQQLLKDIKNVGQFDIATAKDAKGQTTYSLDPAAAFAQGGSGGSANFDSGASALLSKVLAQNKLASQNRDAERASKGLKRGGQKVYARTRTGKVSIKGTPKVRLNKIQLPGVNRSYTPKIKLKPSSNKVKLR